MKPSVAFTLLGFLSFCPEIHAAAYTFTTIDVPFAGAHDTQASGINTSGQIVGYYGDAIGLGLHGFLDNGGIFSSIDVPLASPGATQAFGIDSGGQIVGGYANTATGWVFILALVPLVFFIAGGLSPQSTCRLPAVAILSPPASITKDRSSAFYSGCPGGPYGFLDSGGVFSTISVPFAGATGTEAFGINDRGQVVGLYFDATGGRHGFLATPTPEPATLLLLTSGLAGIVILIRRKRIPKTSAL